MIGNLTIEKANLNVSYMLASLKILSDASGRLARADFVARMAKFMGVSAVAPSGSGENRVPYNKTKFDRYFGFIDVADDGELWLTPRGRNMVACIRERSAAKNPDELYEIDPGRRSEVQELFLDSCCFDSFGSYNCGAESSNSDIEPPRVILRAVKDAGAMTKWELGYLLWGLDGGLFDSYESAIEQIVRNRISSSVDYPTIVSNLGKSNFVKDFKMVDLLCNENVGIIAEVGEKFYLSEDLPIEANRRIAQMNPIATPIQMSLHSAYTESDTMTWIRNAILGRVANPALIFDCQFSENKGLIKTFLASAIAAAYARRKPGAVDAGGSGVNHQNGTVTLVLRRLHNGLNDVVNALPSIAPAFKRKNDFKAVNHGWSASTAQDLELFEMIISKEPSYARMGRGNVILPSNVNIIGVNQ